MLTEKNIVCLLPFAFCIAVTGAGCSMLVGDEPEDLGNEKDTSSNIDKDTATFSIDDTEVCLPDASQGCSAGNIYWFDSCGEQGLLAEDCSSQDRVCDYSGPTVVCTCPNNWTGDNCDICGEHFDEGNDCNGCLPGWYGPDCSECRRFVIGDLTTPGDGLAWSSAFNEIQPAINAANDFVVSGDAPTCEVWVSKGTYHVFDGDSSGNLRIDLKPNLSMVGSLKAGADNRDDRDFNADMSVLYGVFPWNLTTAPDGVYWMVKMESHTELDGFVLSGAVGVPAVTVTGLSDVSIRNNVFLNNTNAWGGGAVYSSGCDNLTIDRCQFYHNGGHPEISNDGLEWGGAVLLANADAIVSNSLFVGNHDDFGGAIHHESGNADYINCIFAGNHATDLYPPSHVLGGSAIFMERGTANVINSSFFNNELVWLDGAYYCTSKAIFRKDISDSTLDVVNSIFRDDTMEDPAFDPFNLNAASITHSNVQGVNVSQNMNLDDDTCVASELLPKQATITTSTFDSNTIQSTVTVSETFAEHELAGMFLSRVRTDRSELERWVYIIDNTQQTLTVWGSAMQSLRPQGSSWGAESFEIHDLRLAANSPCIDAGTVDGAPEADVTGAPRDDSPDMGAFEF